MTISILVEGESERIFVQAVSAFLIERCVAGKAPRLIARPLNSNIPPRNKLIKIVRDELSDGSQAIIVLTDVKRPSNFKDAEDAIRSIEGWLSGLPQLNQSVFVHAAQHELEAWIIPFWPRIQALARSNKPKPTQKPETINHNRPPSRLLGELFRTGNGLRYRKTVHLGQIIEDQNLEIAAKECPGLKSLLNRLLWLCGVEAI